MRQVSYIPEGRATLLQGRRFWPTQTEMNARRQRAVCLEGQRTWQIADPGSKQGSGGLQLTGVTHLPFCSTGRSEASNATEREAARE